MIDDINRRQFLRTSLLAGAALGVSSIGRRAAAQSAMSADAALASLLEGNRRYAEGELDVAAFKADRQAMTAGQTPRAIILGCADSRVPPELIFDQNRGELFVVRVAGNFVTEDGLASIEYAVKVLGTRLIMVLGHSKCGAVDATIKYVKEGAQLPGHLPQLVAAIKPAVLSVRGKPGDLLENAIEANATYNAGKLANAEPIVAPAVQAKQVKVVGAVYDLKTGRVDVLS